MENAQVFGLLGIGFLGLILFMPMGSGAPKYLFIFAVVSGIAWFLSK